VLYWVLPGPATSAALTVAMLLGIEDPSLSGIGEVNPDDPPQGPDCLPPGELAPSGNCVAET